MRAIRTATIACLALCIGGCGANEPGAPVSVGQDESGRTVGLSMGQQLVVALPSNASTGYSWACQSSSSAVLRFDRSEYVPADSGLAGAAGMERFTFTAASAGRATLRCEYRRAWETGVPPVQEVEYGVVVA